MPNASTGVSGFRLQHPTYDGRGVLIGILDSGVDPGIQGLQVTSTGEPKILDVRDVSGEGDVALRQNRDGTWSGELAELRFGNVPQADFNGDGDNRDTFRIEVVRDSTGWKARIDTNGDGSLADETWLHDFLVQRETFTFWGPRVVRGHGPITAALNLTDEDGRPKLAVYLDTSAHGSHVAGIAAGYNIYGVSGFNGAAPGAQILGIRIADNARGGVSTTGSMLRGMEYAYRFAQARHLPLVLNLSFGVGNANESRAVMDSIIDAFLIAHPDVFFAVATGNDGPGLSSAGEPGSAELAVGVGATYPGSFGTLQFGNPNEVLAWFSSRGGELAKPDILAPGVAYSTIPAWNTGEEIKGGTSMASPHVAGLAATLISAMIQEQRPWTAASIELALRATARPLSGPTYVDQGPGLAQVSRAYQWLLAGHGAERLRVEALPETAALPPGMMPSQGGGQAGGRTVGATGGPLARLNSGPLPPGAYRRDGLAGPADTVQRFRVALLPRTPGGAVAQASTYRLVSDAAWLRTTSPTVSVDARTGSAIIDVRYDRALLTRPGRYVGTVTGISAGDSTAGPAFVLANTVVVSAAGNIAVRKQAVPAGGASRYFVRVPESAAGLTATLSIGDTTQMGTLYLFEPTGRPSRGNKSEDIGRENGRSKTISVAAEDLVPGVWEVVVQALPGKDLVTDLDVSVSSLRPAQLGGVTGRGALSLSASTDTTVAVGVELVGASKSEDVTIENGATLRRAVAVPAWAKKMVVEVEVAPETWDQVTDFAITIYDSLGVQIANGAMNYPFHRVSADSLQADRPAGYTATVELFPGFANPVPPARIAARLRIRFEGEPRVVVAPSPLRLRSGGEILPLPLIVPFEAEPGWQPLLRVRAGGDPGGMTQLIALPAGH